MVRLLRKKADRLFFSRLVCGFVVLFVEAKCWVIWFVLAPGEIENKNKFKDPLNDCACFFILHVPLGKRVGPPVGYQIKTYFTIWKNFRYTLYLLDVFLLALMLFLFGFPCRRDIIGQAGSHMVVVKESCSVVWTDSLQSCCSTPRCLYLFYFWRLTSAEGKKRVNGSSSPSQRRLRSVLGFTDDPEDMAVVAVVARPVSLMWVNNRCQDSSAPTPCPPGQNKTCSGWRVWKVLFWPKKIPSEMEGMGDLAKWLQCYKGAVQEIIKIYRESGGLN